MVAGITRTPMSNALRWKYAIRVYEQSPKTGSPRAPWARTYIDEVLSLMQLHKPERIGLGVIWTTFDTPFHRVSNSGGFGWPSARGYYPLPAYMIEEADVAPIKRVYEQHFARKSVHGPYTLALRRFSNACDRRNEEDQLIDCWIGLEALFVAGRSAQSFRGPFRIARYLEDTTAGRNEVFKEAQDSYKLRNKVVHGDTISNGAALAATANLTENLLRRSLVKFLSDSGPLDWRELDTHPFGKP